MSNLLPRARARIHAMTDGKQWKPSDWHGILAIAHAARQHQIDQRRFVAAEAAVMAHSTPERQKALDIAQSAVRASRVILERLVEGVEG